MEQKIPIKEKDGYVILYGFAMDNSVRSYFIENRNLEEVYKKIKELRGFGAYMICMFYTEEYIDLNVTPDKIETI